MIKRLALTGALALTCLLLTYPGLCVLCCYLIAILFSQVFSKRFQTLEKLPALLFGALMPLAPMFGSGTLIAIALSYLLLKSSTFRFTYLNWGSPYLVVTFAWVIATILWHFDLQSLCMIYFGDTGPGSGGLSSVYDWIKFSPPEWLILLQFWTRLALFIAVSAHLQKETQERVLVIQGLLLGLYPALALTLLQLLFPISEYFINQTAFWTGQERLAGTFSDPNAFGVFVALCLPLLYAQYRNKIGREKVALLLLSTAWVLISLFSGSRCFFLGLIFYALYLLYHKSIRLFCCMLALACVGIVVANTAYVIALTPSLPITLERVLVSVQLPHISSAFHSRTVFTKLGFAIWLDNPFLGIGFNNFRDAVVPYAQALSLGTGLWVDNSNDFYLGVLAETGILGAIALLFSLFNVQRNSSGSVFRVGIYCLALLLLLGPHLDFDEIALLSALLFSLSFQFTSRPFFSRPLIILAPLVYALVIQRAYTQERGLYGWEKEGQVHYRWTERRALINLTCNENQQIPLWVRATEPDLGSKPINVSFEMEKDKQQLVLSNFHWSSVSFPCQINSRFSISVETDRLWSPQFYGHATDHRVLGLQLSLNNPH